MSWEDRLKEAAYTAPSGTRAAFQFEDVSRSFDKHTNGFNFPDAMGTYVQDSGASGFKYPLAVYFSGPNCDTEAEAFEKLLRETGIGRLEHPLYGVIDVIPFGTITRSDGLKSQLNQTKIELEFWETNLLIYPMSQADQLSEVFGAISELKGALSVEMLSSIDITNPSAIARFKDGLTGVLSKVKSTLGKIKNITAAVKAIQKKIDSIVSGAVGFVSGIKDAITDVIGGFVDLVTLPGTLVDSFKSQISGYKNLFSELTSFGGVFSNNEDYQSAVTGITVAMSGLVVDMSESSFNTQGEALEVAEEILNIFDDVSAWIEEKAQGLGRTDSNEIYQRLHSTVMIAASYLVQQSFTLKKERKLVLSRSRTIIDLCAELYGEVDDALDFFITSNELSGSEILEVPKGREVLYYV